MWSQTLPEPTFLLPFLTLSFSISSILHLFPTHDETFLPTYPILLFLLPIITTRSTARGVHPQSSQQQSMVYNPSQQLSVVSQPSGVHPQPKPAAGRGVQPPPREVKLSLASNRSWRTPLGESKPSQQQLGVQLQLSQQQFVAYSPF